MLDERQVTFYARSSGVRLDVAEKDVVLTHVLKILSESILPKLAFKGGTCLKKVYFGNTGRFSVDLDFTSHSIPLKKLRDGIYQSFDSKTAYGIDFKVKEDHVTPGRAVDESYLANVHYGHSWYRGEFRIQVSYREIPLLSLKEFTLWNEMYFKYCEFPTFPVMCLQKEEIVAEKLRAALQRTSGRDLYDLYLFAGKHFNKDLVKNLVVVKCWNVREPFNPEKLLSKISNSEYDWNDLQVLVRSGNLPSREDVTKVVMREYAFLRGLNSQLLKIVEDSRTNREGNLVKELSKKFN